MNDKHPSWQLPVYGTSACLILTPCPGTKQASLLDALQDLHNEGARAVLTMMTSPELEDNQVAHLGDTARRLGLLWFHLPIEDECVPGDEFDRLWQESGAQVHKMLDQGQSLAVHCKGGSGRTGLVAARILLERGLPLERSIAQIKALRPNAFTLPLHVDYITALAKTLSEG